jgi:hypothetical protein
VTAAARLDTLARQLGVFDPAFQHFSDESRAWFAAAVRLEHRN